MPKLNFLYVFFLFHILFFQILITTSFPIPKLNFLCGISFPYTLFPHTHYNIIFNAKIKFSIWSFLFPILFFNILITTLLLTPKLNFLDGLFFSIYSFSTDSLQHNFLPKLNFLYGLFFSIYSFSTYSLQHNF